MPIAKGVKVGKISISFAGNIVFGYDNLAARIEQLFVYCSATNYPGVVGINGTKHIWNRCEHFVIHLLRSISCAAYTRKAGTLVVCIKRKNNIATMLEWPLRKALERGGAHDYRMACCAAYKVFHVKRVMYEQLSFVANAPRCGG